MVDAADGNDDAVTVKFGRFWLDFLKEKPRPDVGEITGGIITSGAIALLVLVATPFLTELALITVLGPFLPDIRIQVPKTGGKELVVSGDLFITLYGLIFFGTGLSTCTVHYVEDDLAVFDFPAIGALGGAAAPFVGEAGPNAAAIVARRLADGEATGTVRLAGGGGSRAA